MRVSPEISALRSRAFLPLGNQTGEHFLSKDYYKVVAYIMQNSQT